MWYVPMIPQHKVIRLCVCVRACVCVCVCVCACVCVCGTGYIPTDEDELIGDQSKPYCLPIERGASPPDLKCISPQTVSWLPSIMFSRLL